MEENKTTFDDFERQKEIMKLKEEAVLRVIGKTLFWVWLVGTSWMVTWLLR